jgi:hypothetical protein
MASHSLAATVLRTGARRVGPQRAQRLTVRAAATERTLPIDLRGTLRLVFLANRDGIGCYHTSRYTPRQPWAVAIHGMPRRVRLLELANYRNPRAPTADARRRASGVRAPRRWFCFGLFAIAIQWRAFSAVDKRDEQHREVRLQRTQPHHPGLAFFVVR